MDKTICQRRQHHCAAHGCIRECTGATGRGELVVRVVIGGVFAVVVEAAKLLPFSQLVLAKGVCARNIVGNARGRVATIVGNYKIMVIIRCPITIRRLCFLQAIEGVNVQTAKRYVAAGVGHYISFFAFPSSGSVILFQTELCTGQNLVWRAGVLDDGQAVGVEVDTGSSSRTGSKAGVALLVLPLTIQRCSVLKGEGIAFNQTFRINSVMENQHKRGAIGYLCPCLKLVAVIAAVLE